MVGVTSTNNNNNNSNYHGSMTASTLFINGCRGWVGESGRGNNAAKRHLKTKSNHSYITETISEMPSPNPIAKNDKNHNDKAQAQH